MSEYCPHCGRGGTTNIKRKTENVNSEVHLKEEEVSSNPWSCFVSFCSKKHTTKTNTTDVALNSEFIDAGAIYKRRSTVQFQPEPLTDTTLYRRITYNKLQQPLSKFKVK